jgi:AraC-like DNA-binding protein
MPHDARGAPVVRALGSEAWVRELLGPGSAVELIICRYHHRSGEFDTFEPVTREHMVSFVEQGYLPVETGGLSRRVSAGDLLWIPPGSERRYYGTPETPVMRHYNLRFRLTRGREQLSFLRRPALLHNAWEVHAAMGSLHDLFQHGHALSGLRLRALIAVLATGFVSLARASGREDGGRRLSPAQRRSVDRCIVDRIGEGLSPEDLALETGLSPDYFTRLFRRTYGVPPRRHLKRERARLAAVQLRETRASVAEIARRCGTDNVSLFCRQFRDEMSCTPSEYRRRETGPAP